MTSLQFGKKKVSASKLYEIVIGRVKHLTIKICIAKKA